MQNPVFLSVRGMDLRFDISVHPQILELFRCQDSESLQLSADQFVQCQILPAYPRHYLFTRTAMAREVISQSEGSDCSYFTKEVERHDDTMRGTLLRTPANLPKSQ